eukprot:g32025.t1
MYKTADASTAGRDNETLINASGGVNTVEEKDNADANTLGRDNKTQITDHEEEDKTAHPNTFDGVNTVEEKDKSADANTMGGDDKTLVITSEEEDKTAHPNTSEKVDTSLKEKDHADANTSPEQALNTSGGVDTVEEKDKTGPPNTSHGVDTVKEKDKTDANTSPEQALITSEEKDKTADPNTSGEVDTVEEKNKTADANMPEHAPITSVEEKDKTAPPNTSGGVDTVKEKDHADANTLPEQAPITSGGVDTVKDKTGPPNTSHGVDTVEEKDKTGANTSPEQALITSEEKDKTGGVKTEEKDKTADPNASSNTGDKTGAGEKDQEKTPEEEKEKLAQKLQITEAQPRSSHEGLIATRDPKSGAAVFLANRLSSPWLPSTEQAFPHEQRHVAAARPGESCAERSVQDMCQRLRMICSDFELEFINDCAALKAHFPCEEGCGHQVGEEIPCYVHEASRDTGKQCLAYIAFHIPADHLLAASVMSCPAALAMAKLSYPETEISRTNDLKAVTSDGSGNVLDAMATGVITGISLAGTIAGMLIAFLVGLQGLTFDLVMSYAMWPLAFMMGVPQEDCLTVGLLIGQKTVLNEFVAYRNLADLVAKGAISTKAEVIATYALCGFSNFASIGIQVGGLSVLAPSRKQDFARLALRAMVTGSVACFMTGCIAGVPPGKAVSAPIFCAP